MDSRGKRYPRGFLRLGFTNNGKYDNMSIEPICGYCGAGNKTRCRSIDEVNNCSLLNKKFPAGFKIINRGDGYSKEIKYKMHINEVKEVKRKIQFESGHSLTLKNLVGYTANDTTLGLHLEDGDLVIVNPDKVLYHKITPNGETTK